MSARQVVLDTETTGLEVTEGHRVIEIGCVELVNRKVTGNDFHHYLNPERDIDAGALSVHGITAQFLAEKPKFAAIVDSLIEYLEGAELVIHNADFDVGFLDMEFERAGVGKRIADLCRVTDTLVLARELHPGQKNTLDALCRRYEVNASHRELHGALLDARLLSDVYLAMTGGQSAMVFEQSDAKPRPKRESAGVAAIPEESGELVVVRACDSERDLHRQRLEAIREKAGRVLWEEDLGTAAHT